MAHKQLITAVNVIDALGGNARVAKLLRTTPTAVSNWRYFGTMPPRTYVAMKHELNRRGYDAPSKLWAMNPVRPRKNNFAED